MKKLLVALGIVFGLLVLAALIVPMVVDVDKYRPQIVSAANENINGELTLGKLSLSLWGQIRVQVDGVQLKDAAGKSLVSVGSAYFHIPLMSVLSGSPQFIFKMQKPEVTVVKDRAGKINLLSLMKTSAAPAATPPTGTPAAASHSPTQVPAFAARARIGVELDDANLTYKDELSGLNSQVSDLNLILRDVSLSHPTDIEISAMIDTQMKSATGGQPLIVKGPVKLTGTGVPQLEGGNLENLSMKMNIDLDQLEITLPGTFEKSKTIPMHADLEISGNSKEARIQKMEAVFHNAVIQASGTITNLGAAPMVDMKLSSNEIELKPWVQILPMLKEYELGGSAKLEADAKGEAAKLGYHAHFEIKKLTAKAPHLKVQPEFNVVLDVITDQIDNLTFTMSAPSNDLQFKGKLVSFTAPHGDFTLTSNSLDLDQLIDFPKPAPAAAKGAPATPGTPEAKAPASDLDAMLAPLRSNKILANTSVTVNTHLKMLKVQGVKMEDLVGKLYLKDLVAGLDGFSVKLWGGTVGMTMAAQLKPETPHYRFTTNVANLDLAQAIESQMNFFKNTASGRANFTMTGEGSSFNTIPAEKNLVAKGNFKLTNANFTTIDVGKMVTDALNKSIDKVGDKFSALKGKSVKGLPAGGSKYDLMSSDFSIKDGRFVAPNFVAKATPNKGIDLKGDTEVGLIDYSLKTSWEVTDTYNVTGAKDLSANVGGIQIDHVLSEKGQPVRFPIQAGCTILQPCYSYTQVLEFLSKVALGNAAGAAKSQAVQKLIPSNAPPAVSNALKKLFHP